MELIDKSKLINITAETEALETQSRVRDMPTIINIPNNATNGDVIKTLFPDIEIADIPCLDKVYTGIPFGKYIGANIDCMREWWNAPYKVESEDKE